MMGALTFAGFLTVASLRKLIFVSVEMKNSPTQPGPDLLTISFQVRRGVYKGVRVKRSAASLYLALNDLFDLLLLKLNRYSDRIRVKQRSSARRLLQLVSES